MSVKQVLQLEADSITGQSIKIPFEFSDKSSVPKGKDPGDSIVISPITTHTWFKLKPLIAQIDSKDIKTIINSEENGVSPAIMGLMSKYDALIFEIVCIGIHNKRGVMPEWFRNALKDNTTWEDIFILLNAILFRLNHNSFINTIILARSVSPLDEEEIIALQKNRETWELKAASCSSPSVGKR